MLSASAILKLKDADTARTGEERFVCRVLQTEGPGTVSQMTQRLAQQMYEDALLHGGRVTDIGLFGPRLFESDALAVLQDMKDRCISLEPENGG